jgi:hypothetical protein
MREPWTTVHGEHQWSGLRGDEGRIAGGLRSAHHQKEREDRSRSATSCRKRSQMRRSCSSASRSRSALCTHPTRASTRPRSSTWHWPRYSSSPSTQPRQRGQPGLGNHRTVSTARCDPGQTGRPGQHPAHHPRRRKELHQAAEQVTGSEAGLIAVGEPTIDRVIDWALTDAAKVVKRTLDATTDEPTSELQEALKS